MRERGDAILGGACSNRRRSFRPQLSQYIQLISAISSIFYLPRLGGVIDE